MTAYYNENEPYVAQWLRNLIQAGLIALGEVDERSIKDVQPGDLEGFTQCHFFAGIGGWSLALRIAGWPDDRPVWTGSFPCQDISAASAGRAVGLTGKRSGLWFEFYRLIDACRPPRIGIENSPRLRLLGADRIFADLEKANYACRHGVVGANHVKAPHLRKRIWIIAHGHGHGLRQQSWRSCRPNRQDTPVDPHAINSDRNDERHLPVDGQVAGQHDFSSNPDRQGLAVGESLGSNACAQLEALERAVGAEGYKWNGGPASHFRVAYGLSAGMARPCTKAFGNAIVPQVAAEFIKAYMD